MSFKKLSEDVSVCAQISVNDLNEIAASGFKTIICNRPDYEAEDQPSRTDIEAKANELGMKMYYLPLPMGQAPSEELLAQFNTIFDQAEKPVLAFCRSGNRSGQIYNGAMAQRAHAPDVSVSTKAAAGSHYTVLVIGGGTAGISVTQSLLKRDSSLNIAIVDPSRAHDYQAAWTLVGAGEYDQKDTRRAMVDVIPDGVLWISQAATIFLPDENKVALADGSVISYDTLIVCPGLKLNWAGIEGLEAALGKGGVTSNYRYDLAPYTWELVKNFKGGNALFTQPSMPIKCAGAPQKALYLSCSHWESNDVLKNTKVQFFNAGAALFGVADFVPPLMEYVRRYHAQLQFSHNLIKIDGLAKVATFRATNAQGEVSEIEQAYDMIHVVPPQCSPDFVAQSPLAAASGWVDVNQHTLQHVKYPNVFSLGDAGSMPNAKTTAAVRKQAPIVASNLLAFLKGAPLVPKYDGYGACPLTVEKGKVILAEFGYGGKLMPTFPMDPLVARQTNWILKKYVFPRVYWDCALKGREWFTQCGDKSNGK